MKIEYDGHFMAAAFILGFSLGAMLVFALRIGWLRWLLA